MCYDKDRRWHLCLCTHRGASGMALEPFPTKHSIFTRILPPVDNSVKPFKIDRGITMAVSLSIPNCKKVRADSVHRLPRPAAEPAPIVINRLGMTNTKGQSHIHIDMQQPPSARACRCWRYQLRNDASYICSGVASARKHLPQQLSISCRQDAERCVNLVPNITSLPPHGERRFAECFIGS